MPVANTDASAPPRHAQLFELIRQENLSDRITSKLKFSKRRIPAAEAHQQFLNRAHQSWNRSRTSHQGG